MAKLPESFTDPVAEAIYRHRERRNREESWLSRSLGSSNPWYGKGCVRALWYAFRWAADASFTGQRLGAIAAGYAIEDRVMAELKAIGLEIVDRDPERPERQLGAYVLDGHGAHYAEGVATSGVPGAEKTPHLLEIKALNAKRFRALVKKGVEGAEPSHYAQCQLGMEAHGVERCLYIVVNRDSEELRSWRLRKDPAAVARYLDMGRTAIYSDMPPPRISHDPSFWLCRFCDYAGTCHGTDLPRVSCRTCAEATPEEGGRWTCALAKRAGCSGKAAEIPKSVQESGCTSHVYAPAHVPLEVSDAGVDDDGLGWVEYEGGLVNGARGLVGEDFAREYDRRRGR